MSSKIPSLSILKLLSQRFIDHKIKHALGGSGLLYSLGLIENVKDWDITVESPLEDVIKVLGDLSYEKIPHNDQFKSDYLIKVIHEQTEIDIIGNFRVVREDGFLHKVPVKISGKWNDIPVADPYEWMLAYKYMQRGTKALLLENYLKKHNQ
nr:hypothetical protein BHI3_23850 [Bacteriovorax sp. HI3]